MLGVACDFDGTLAAIVDDPAMAVPVAGAVEVLSALRRAGARVLVVSGRPLDFLAARLGDELDLAALYGLQQRMDGVVSVHPEAEPWAAVVAAAAASCREELAGTRARVEDKGLSLTLHWREAPDAEAAARRVAERLAAGTGLEPRAARASIELHPPVAMDKGRAVLDRLRGCDPVVMLGDDRGDLAAFAALDELARDLGASTRRIAVRSAESPPELLERADEVVEGPEGVVTWLRGLARSLDTATGDS